MSVPSLPTTIADSRRLTGPSLLLDRPGAVLDLQLEPARQVEAVRAWERAARELLARVGWPDETLASRRYGAGVSLALTAPVDALYAATDLNEAAWALGSAGLDRRPAPDLDATVTALRQAIAGERNPRLTALADAARARGVAFLSGESLVSVGEGGGAKVWPETDLPAVEEVDWAGVHDIPVALVTGSNGKTTVVRLLTAILAAAGRVAGLTSTEGVRVGGLSLADGDFSGPSGARLLLRHPAVEVAVLETARGGLLRRGLTVARADAAVVTNIAEDHLGEFGIEDVAGLADVKLLVARALGRRGTLVLNADDAELRTRGERHEGPIAWFTLDPANPLVARHLANGGRAAMVDAGRLALAHGTERLAVADIAEVPLAAGGAARHNVANALAAIAAAWALGVEPGAMREPLRRFGSGADDNAGRANVLELAGVRVIVDYAHNPHGMAALASMVAAMPAARRLVLVGQAGDRSDAAIRELARSALLFRPDRVVVKEMERYLRGRAPGEIPALMADELRRQGLPAEAIACPGSELEAVRHALDWARPGDLLLLTVHEDRPGVMALLERLGRRGPAG